MKSAVFKLNLSLHYLSIGIWVGALVGFVFAAVSSFAVAEHFNLTVGIAPFNNPGFSTYSADIVAGAIVMRALNILQYFQVVLAVVLIVTTALHSTLFSRWCFPAVLSRRNLIRIALVAAIVIIMGVTQFAIFPHMKNLRKAMYSPGQSVAAKVESRQQFNQYHALSQNLTSVMVVLLISTICITPFTVRYSKTLD